ncbi:hypothetical protein BDN70DRAFT_918273 [Pholiota conissans]|uniref:MYND-type domain-containing protein n=1 Tax=Pholiota conissans TaxID=109636 RepID=A0A9P5ZA40_9AGAR|nr:hypothetical protein BDN70DRAFT_918273 [Pholiota conissans]
MSDDENVLNLRDEEYFPTFDQLPYDNDVSPRYYACRPSDGAYAPIKHWCFLVEIVEKVKWIRPTFRVKDKNGRELLVMCYFDSDFETPSIWEKRCKQGGVMAMMYANFHNFMDGQTGIRVEEGGTLTFLPCSLETLLRIGDDLDKPSSNICVLCKKPGVLQCARCSSTRYCGKECQVADWKPRHKDECIAIQQVKKWKGKEWKAFDGKYWIG